MAIAKMFVLKANGDKSEWSNLDELTLPIRALAPVTTPPAGYFFLYALADGFYQMDSLGATTKLSNVAGGGGGLTNTEIMARARRS